jgi:hypothetical protein
MAGLQKNLTRTGDDEPVAILMESIGFHLFRVERRVRHVHLPRKLLRKAIRPCLAGWLTNSDAQINLQ